MITIARKADLTRMCRVENMSGVTFTGENGGHKFVITAYRDEEIVPLTGSVSGKFIRPGGYTVALTQAEGYAGIEDGKAWVSLAGNCYTEAGPFGLTITHIDGEKRTVIYACTGYVRPGETSSIVDPESLINVDAISGMIADLHEAIEEAEGITDVVDDLKNAINEIVPELVNKSEPFNIPSGAVKSGYLNEDRSYANNNNWRRIDPRTLESGDICIEFPAPGCSMLVYVWQQTGENTYQLIANSGWTTRPVVVHGGEGVSFGMSFHDDTSSRITNEVVTSYLSIHYLYDLAGIKTSAEQEVSVDTTLSLAGVPADAQAVGNAINNLDVDTDDTLSLEGKAADAKATGDEIGCIKNAFDAAMLELIDENEKATIPAGNIPTGYYNGDRSTTSSNKHRRIHRARNLTSGNIYIRLPLDGYLINVLSWEEVEGTYNLILNSGWTSGPVLVHGGENVSYVISFVTTGNVTISSQDISDNLLIYKLYDIAAIKSSAEQEVSVDTTLSLAGVPADAKATGDAINAIGGVKSYIDIDTATIIENALCRNGAGVSSNQPNFNTISYYPIDEADVNTKFYVNTRCFISEYTEANRNSLIRKTMECNNKTIIQLHPDTRYVRISYFKIGIPGDKFLMIPLNNDAAYVMGDLLNKAYDMPPTYAQANILASARQFLNLEYTTSPNKYMPYTKLKQDGETHWYAKPGSTLTGVPYSSTRSVCKYIGQHVSLYTFLSAVKNENSVLYTRRITNGGLGSTYYGATCFTFPAYATGSRLGFFDNLFSRRYDSNQLQLVSSYDVQIGDILLTSKNPGTRSHVAMVLDLHKDEYGRIEAIEVAEQAYPKTRSGVYPFVVRDGKIHDAGNGDGYWVFRLKNRIDDRTGYCDYGTYEKLDFVQGFKDEIPVAPVFPDIMSEYGDKAAIEAFDSEWDNVTNGGAQPSRNVRINVINPDGYNSISVYRSDDVNGTFTIYNSMSGLPVEDFTIENIPWGTYKFVLNGTNKTSESTLVAVDVHGEYSYSNKTVSCWSENAYPVFAAAYCGFDGPDHPGVQYRTKRFKLSELDASSGYKIGRNIVLNNGLHDIIDSTRNQVQVGFYVEGYGVAMWKSLQMDEWETLQDGWWNESGGNTDPSEEEDD